MDDHKARSQHIRAAIEHLRQARDHLDEAETPRTLTKVRLALKSAEGAFRHAENLAIRHAQN